MTKELKPEGMKRLFTIMALCLAVTAASAQTGVQSVLNQILGSDASKNTVTSILENVVGGAISKLDLSIDGTWKYSEPEVQFKSDNLLAQAGGAAATGKIENKLSGLYGKIGMNESLSYTFNADSTFTQTVKIGKSVKTLKGTYTLDKENKTITFRYNAFGLSPISAIYANTGTSLALMFDATQLMNFFKKMTSLASSLTGKASLSAVSAVIDTYDGAMLGYKLKR